MTADLKRRVTIIPDDVAKILKVNHMILLHTIYTSTHAQMYMYYRYPDTYISESGDFLCMHTQLPRLQEDLWWSMKAVDCVKQCLQVCSAY